MLVRHIPLSRAPLVYAAKAFDDEELTRFINLSELPGLIPNLLGEVPRLVTEVELTTRIVRLNRLNPFGAAIEIDLVRGSASVWGIQSAPGPIKRRREIEGSVPFILATLGQRADHDTLLHAALSDLWVMLVASLVQAHRADPREVDVRGRQVGSTEFEVLDPEIWDHALDWLNEQVSLPGPLASASSTDTSGSRRTWRKVRVTYLGERPISAEDASEARVRSCFERLTERIKGRALASRREQIWAEEQRHDPALRRSEFDSVWRVIKALSAQNGNLKLGRPGPLPGAQPR